MAQQMVPVILIIEPKEDQTLEGVQPGLPTGAGLASYLDDILGDRTKHDGNLGWRVIGAKATIHPASSGGPS